MHPAWFVWIAGALVWILGFAAPIQPAPTMIPPGSLGIAVSGQMSGYMTPCGCSKPMIGGLARRANYLASLGKSLVKVENGDLTKALGRQDEIKAETIAEILNLMGYDALNLGERDFALGMDKLKQLQERFKGAVLSANAHGPDGKPIFGDVALVEPEIEGKKVRVAIVGVLADEFAGQVKQDCPEVDLKPAEATIEALKAKFEIAPVRVLLFHGPRAPAEGLAKRFPEFQVVVSTHDLDDPIQPAPRVGDVQLLSPGKDGKHIQLAVLDPKADWHVDQVQTRALSPELGENDAVISMFAIYGERVAGEGLLARVPKLPSPNGDAFAGSDACASCHAEETRIWKSSRHAQAMVTLIEAKHDRDPECVGCHVVGLETIGGYVGHQETPHLKDVGCESCHGPAAKHVEDPMVKTTPAGGEKSCMSCHVPNHSPKFDYKTYWDMIKH